MKTISPVQLDGLLYAALGFFVFAQGYFSGDEAMKVVSPQVKFWVSFVIGSGAAVAGALKMYRSTSFSEHKAAKNGTGNTEIITKA